MKNSICLVCCFFVSTIISINSFALKPDDIKWEPLYEPGGGGAIVSVAVSPHNSKHIIAGGDMLGVGVTFNGGKSWEIANKGLTSYEMATPTFHPSRTNEVWMGSCMGLFKSVDGGRSWTPSRKGMPEMIGWRYSAFIEKVLFDPNNKKHLIAFGGSSRRWGTSEGMGAIWHSIDDGESWTRSGTLTTNGFTTAGIKGANIIKAFWGPGKGKKKLLHAMAEPAGWFTSKDNGYTWVLREPSGLDSPIVNIAVHPKNPKIFWAVTKAILNPEDGKYNPGSVFKSIDGGKTFFKSDKNLPKTRNQNVNITTRFPDIVVSPVDPNVLYVSDRSWHSSSIWRSDDGGESWRCVCAKWMKGFETACYAGPACGVVPSPHSASCTYAYNSEYILCTKDSGEKWEDLTAMRPDPTKPLNWRGRGWNGWCSRKYVFNPYRKGESIMLAMDAGHGWHSKDNLKSWRYAAGQGGPWLGANDAAFSKDNYIYIATGQRNANCGVMVSNDGGETWTNRMGSACGLIERGAGVYDAVWVDPENGKSAFVLACGKRFITTDGGESWVSHDLSIGRCSFAIDPTKSGRFYVKNKDDIYVTEDWKNFKALGLGGAPAEGEIACDAKGRVLVCRGRSTREKTGLWRYDPRDGVWVCLNSERLANAVATDPKNPSFIILSTNDMPYHDFAGGHGLFMSDDDGKTWVSCEMGGMMRRFSSIAFDPFDSKTIIVGQGGGGFIRGTSEALKK